jgi:hypothetical protein
MVTMFEMNRLFRDIKTFPVKIYVYFLNQNDKWIMFHEVIYHSLQHKKKKWDFYNTDVHREVFNNTFRENYPNWNILPSGFLWTYNISQLASYLHNFNDFNTMTEIIGQHEHKAEMFYTECYSNEEIKQWYINFFSLKEEPVLTTIASLYD